LPSPNGATCIRYAEKSAHLLVGALINARAVAAAASELMTRSNRAVAIIACGERWSAPTEDGELRMAIEDYLGAGAILSCLKYDKSPEARVCEGAFLQAQDELEEIVWDCASGRELRERGFQEDVRYAVKLNFYDSVPILQGERLERYSAKPRRTSASASGRR
jgi:2-phosphosulfolactate phosphatase